MYKGHTQGRAPVPKMMSERESIHGRNKQESLGAHTRPELRKETETLSAPLFSKSADLLVPAAQLLKTLLGPPTRTLALKSARLFLFTFVLARWPKDPRSKNDSCLFVPCMDAFARGLKIAHAIHEDGRLNDFVSKRYSSFDSGIGAKIESGEIGFEELDQYVHEQGEPDLASGRQEMLENLINDFI